MTREEEILQEAIKEACYIAGISQTKEEAAIGGYCLGVAYADKTMLDRACEWLSIYYPNIDRMGIDKFITAFRQAMEGGAE